MGFFAVALKCRFFNPRKLPSLMYNYIYIIQYRHITTRHVPDLGWPKVVGMTVQAPAIQPGGIVS